MRKTKRLINRRFITTNGLPLIKSTLTNKQALVCILLSFVFSVTIFGDSIDSLNSSVPHDGTFYIEGKPQYAVKATLIEKWKSKKVGHGVLHVYAPVLPDIEGQSNVSSRLTINGKETTEAREIIENSIEKRRMLFLAIDAADTLLQSGISLQLEYNGIIYSRKLKIGKPSEPLPQLTPEEKKIYLCPTITMDYQNTGLVKWINEKKLIRKSKEDTTHFAHRVFTYFVDNGRYGGDTSSYNARRPSMVFTSLASDCGGLALLFVAVMRYNNIPARTLFGRWAISQNDDYGQYHVIAEFFVEQSGWIPVDISGTIVHKPEDKNAFFGNTDGQFLVFHIDTDLEPDKGYQHAWAQYLLLQWSGDGDFWKEYHFESKWEVSRSQLQ